jgi:hypothetical protein
MTDDKDTTLKEYTSDDVSKVRAASATTKI